MYHAIISQLILDCALWTDSQARMQIAAERSYARFCRVDRRKGS